jgi:hypothetical protein
MFFYHYLYSYLIITLLAIMKSWKNLFVRDNESEEQNQAKSTDGFSFPAVVNTPQPSGNVNPGTGVVEQAVINEVLMVYEKGIDSINMPGYDFYEFYKAIGSINNAGEQAYHMAYQMAKSMDSSLSSQKLLSDAEFYISKINEVHNQYSMQGQQKISSLEAKKNDEKNKLTADINDATQQVNQLRTQMQELEAQINQKRTRLTAVDGDYLPQENTIRQKLLANDNAKQISILKLSSVKDGIQNFIK